MQVNHTRYVYYVYTISKAPSANVPWLSGLILLLMFLLFQCVPVTLYCNVLAVSTTCIYHSLSSNIRSVLNFGRCSDRTQYVQGKELCYHHTKSRILFKKRRTRGSGAITRIQSVMCYLYNTIQCKG